MKLEKVAVQKGTTIQYHSKELLFLAQSGQPYRGSLYINFTSVGESFNLLDLKKYITSLRGQTFTAENIAYEIFQTIDNSIKSKDLGVVVDLTARGGIQQRIGFGEGFEPVERDNVFQV